MRPCRRIYYSIVS